MANRSGNNIPVVAQEILRVGKPAAAKVSTRAALSFELPLNSLYIVPLQQSTMTSNILCINKDESFPLRYNIQGCVGGSYTQSYSTRGVCLTNPPNSSLFLTVENLQPGRHQFVCYKNSQFTSMTAIVCEC